MKVSVNNKEKDVANGTSIKSLSTEMELPEKGIAIAVNNKMIPRTEWNSFILNENDHVIIIKATCGG